MFLLSLIMTKILDFVGWHSNKIRIIPLIYSGDFDYEDEDSSEIDLL